MEEKQFRVNPGALSRTGNALWESILFLPYSYMYFFHGWGHLVPDLKFNLALGFERGPVQQPRKSILIQPCLKSHSVLNAESNHWALHCWRRPECQGPCIQHPCIVGVQHRTCCGGTQDLPHGEWMSSTGSSFLSLCCHPCSDNLPEYVNLYPTRDSPCRPALHLIST